MKKSLIAITGAVLGLSFFVVTAQPALAANKHINSETSKPALLAKNETHKGALYATGEVVEINGTVDGDVYCAAQKVVITGTVKGDVLCGAQLIDIKGTVEQDVRLAGQVINITGNIGRNVSVLAQVVSVDNTATIAGGLNGAGQVFNVLGNVAGDIALGADKFSLSGTAGADVDLGVAGIELKDGAAIKGNLNYASDEKISIPEEAVSGNISFTENEKINNEHREGLVAMKIILGIAVAIMVSTAVLVMIAPRYFEKSYKKFHSEIGMSLLVGAVVALTTPVLLLMLVLTIIGLPLAGIGFTAWALVLMLSYAFASYYLGRLAFGKVVNNSILVALGGAALLAILSIIPFVNFIVIPLALIAGTGGLVLTVVNGYKKPTYKLKG